jgi:hypothetical protein
MSSQYDNEMVRMGIIHFKSGEFPAARRYFERALEVADDNDTRFKANLYLSRLLDDPAEKRRALKARWQSNRHTAKPAANWRFWMANSSRMKSSTPTPRQPNPPTRARSAPTVSPVPTAADGWSSTLTGAASSASTAPATNP